MLISSANFRLTMEAIRAADLKVSVRRLVLSSSEIMVNLILVSRALELIYLYEPEEPLLRALCDVGHIPVRYHGFMLLAACFVHLLSIIYKKWRLRAFVLLAQMAFFMFSWFVLIIVGKPFLGMIVLPTIALFCLGNAINVVWWDRTK